MISGEGEVTSSVKFCCGLPTFIIEGNDEFELEVNKSKDVISIPLLDFLNSHLKIP